MQDDNIVAAQPQPTVIYPEVLSSTNDAVIKTKKRQELYEYAMLAFGIITIASFFIQNGFMLKIGVGLFLIVAIVSISSSLSNSKKIVKPTPVQTENSAVAGTAARKVSAILKILGITLLVVVSLPIIGYTILIVIVIVMMVLGGGDTRMGT